MSQSASSSVAPMSSLSDAEIADRAARGDGSAFRVIMERNNGRLYRVARSVLKNDSEAEDVVQESYVRAYPQLKAFRGESSLATWLTRITLNEALGRLRRRRPTRELSDLDSPAVRSAAEVIWFPGAADGSDPERAPPRATRSPGSWRKPSTRCRSRSASFSSCAPSRK